MGNEKKIEIPFGAFDSELIHQEINIPNGFNAVIDGNKIILTRVESEDERIRKEMIFYFTEEIPQCSIQEHSDKMREFISWLKRQEVERTKLELKAGSSYFCYKSRWERADSETFKKGLIYMCNKDGVLDNFVIKNPEQHFIEIKDERIAWLEKQGEQKSAWSEEDERMCQETIDWFEKKCFPYALESENPARESIKWLKSLKDRVQPKQEWTKEDEKIFDRICALIHSAAYKNYDVDEDGNECGEYANIKEWFKKLKDRVQLQNITITDEELVQAKKDAYNDALDKIEYHSGEPTFDDGWSAAIWYLKKRNAQPQNRWKPSDEQIEILDMVLTNESLDDNIARILRELREHLKAHKREYDESIRM